MADAGRVNLLAAIRAKGQTPPVEAPKIQPRAAVQETKTSPPQNASAAGSSSGADMPKGPAPAALAMKAALAQMGGNIRANLKPTSASESNETKPSAAPAVVRPPLAPRPSPVQSKTPPPSAPKGPMPFSAADLQAQIKLRAQKKAEVSADGPSSTTNASAAPPKLDLDKVPAGKKSILSYRAGVLTKIDPPAKLKLSPRPILEEPRSEDGKPKSSSRSIESQVKPNVAPESREKEEPKEQQSQPNTPKKDLDRNSSREMKAGVSPPRKSASRDLRRGCSAKGSESDRPALPSLISPSRADSGRRPPPPVSAIPRSMSSRSRKREKVSKLPVTPSASPSIATPTPGAGVDPSSDGSPPAISPPAVTSKNGTEYRLLTEPGEIQKAWRKLSCKVLRDGDDISFEQRFV